MSKVSSTASGYAANRDVILKWYDDCSDINNFSMTSQVMDTYMELAERAQEAGDFELAKRMMDAAANQSTELQSTWSVRSQQNWSLVRTYVAQERFQRAEMVARQSVEIAESVLGKTNYQISIELERLAEILMLRNNYRDAYLLYKRIIGLAHRRFGRRHSELAPILKMYAHINMKLGKDRRADFVLAAAERIEQGTAEQLAVG